MLKKVLLLGGVSLCLLAAPNDAQAFFGQRHNRSGCQSGYAPSVAYTAPVRSNYYGSSSHLYRSSGYSAYRPSLSIGLGGSPYSSGYRGSGYRGSGYRGSGYGVYGGRGYSGRGYGGSGLGYPGYRRSGISIGVGGRSGFPF